MTDTLTHDIAALAEAERAEWRTTCDDLHERLAAVRLEADRLIAHVDAADQRARTLDATLAHEREAGRGLVAQVEALRVQRDSARRLLGRVYNMRNEARSELRAIRDLVAPGNPQGTVVDAVRTTMHALSLVRDDRDRASAKVADLTAERDAAIARAEKAERDVRELRMGYVNVCDAIAAETHSPAHAASIACETRHERDRLCSELAELRARPVLTVEALREAIASRRTTEEGPRIGTHQTIYAQLTEGSPVTLPSPDFAQVKGAAALLRKIAKVGALAQGGEQSPNAAECLDAAREIEAALAKLSPAPAREAAPTLVAVSDEELMHEFYTGAENGTRTVAGIRAVRAKLGVAEVTAKMLAEAWLAATGFDAPEALKDPAMVRARMAKAFTIVAARRTTAQITADRATAAKPAATCSTCGDTHRMTLGDRDVPCTHCPTPCDECRAGLTAYCRKSCNCKCHRATAAKGGRS